MWNILEDRPDGTLERIATFYHRSHAEQSISAHAWMESLGSGLMKLQMDGITIDARTGKPWVPPKTKRTPVLKIEATKTRRRKA